LNSLHNEEIVLPMVKGEAAGKKYGY